MPTPFAPSTLEELAGRLKRRRQAAALRADTSQADATSALVDLDLSDLLDSENPDGGNHDADRARALARLASGTVKATEDALTRLAAGTYGTCEACDDRIPLARLRALPEAKACVTCTAGRRRPLAPVA